MDVQQVTKSQFKGRALELFRKIEESGLTVVVTDRTNLMGSQPVCGCKRALTALRYELNAL